MGAWLKRQLSSRRTLKVLIFVYVALAGVELFRITLFERPSSYATGFYAWEAMPDTGAPFRWTGGEARLRRPVGGAVLTVPVHLGRPDLDGAGLPLAIFIEDELVDAVVLRENGWHDLAYYVPPLVGEEVWAEVLEAGESRLSPLLDSPSELQAAQPLGRFTRWRELQPWASPQGPPAVRVRLEVGSTFVPSQVLGGDDHRSLGMGVGALNWSATVPVDGIGFHAWEQTADGEAFRWTQRRASQPLRTGGERAVFHLRADHPDIIGQPVEVSIFWGARLLETVSLTDPAWSDVVVSTGVPAGSVGVLSLYVDRVWTPSSRGQSDDARRLGVAMSAVAWR